MSSKRTPAYWARFNYDAAKTAMGEFLAAHNPEVKAAALADAHRFAYGAEINARDAEDGRLVKLASSMREDTGRLLAELAARALAADAGLN